MQNQNHATVSTKLDMWLMANTKFFPEDRLPYIRDRLSRLPESEFNSLYTLRLTDPVTSLLLSIFLGHFGVDRFVIGDVGMGLGKLFTYGGCLVWWFIDIFLITGRTKAVNFEKMLVLMNQHGI